MQTEARVELDVHGKNLYQARVAIDAALRRCGGAYRLCVIHGCNHGDAIARMIRAEYADHPKVLELLPGAGRTELVLRRL